MKYIKKNLIFLNLQKILEKNTFVLFFQYTHLKNKEWTFFKNILQKKNYLYTTKSKKKKIFFNKNIYICNNKILSKYFEKNKTLGIFNEKKIFKRGSENLQTITDKNYLAYNIFDNFIFCAQGPTACIFFNDIDTLQFFFNEIFFFCVKREIENVFYLKNFIDKKKQEKNNIFLQKKNYTVQIKRNLFFIGGIYKQSFVNIHTLQNICLLNNNVYNTFTSIYFVYIQKCLNTILYIKFKYIYSFILIFHILHTYLYKYIGKNNLKK